VFLSPGPIKNLLEEASELSSPGRARLLLVGGELGGNLLPYFDYKMAEEAEGKGFNTLGIHISLKISEEKKKEVENRS